MQRAVGVMDSDVPLWIVPRARLADALRTIASAITGLITLLVALTQPWLWPLAIVLLGYAIALGIKMADTRPALIATRRSLKVFRFPGQSHEIEWQWLTEVAWLKMRVKKVLFFKIERRTGDIMATTTIEMPSTDFSGKGREVVRRLTEYRDQFA